MPLYLKSHPPWSQTLDALLTRTPSTGVCAAEPQNDLPLEPTLTPSPVSSSTTTAEPTALPFTLASRSLVPDQQSPSELSESYHQSHFLSRPASASESRQDDSSPEQNLSPHPQPYLSDDHHHQQQLPGLNPLTQQSPLLSSLQPASGNATDQMRSLEILDHAPDRLPPHSFPSHFPAVAASSSEHQHPSPHPLADLAPTDPPTDLHPSPLHKTTRGNLRVINRPIQPIEGPPPPPLQKARGPWHKDEDTALLYWVSHLGTGKWVDIAKRVGSRSGKQCRERWTNQLSPEIDHSTFRHEEDMVIITMQQSLQANKWCEVAKYLPGRPENAIKNRWNSRDLQRKRNELCVNMNSVVAPFGLMLENQQEVSRMSSHVGLPFGASPKRARSPQTSSIDLHHRLGLPYQTPRHPSGNGTKKHRVVIEPHTAVHRNHVNSLHSPSKLRFTTQNEGLLVPPPNQSLFGHHPVEMSGLSGPSDLHQDWAYHTTTPPNTCSTSNPRVHCLQRNPEFGASLSQYYSTPTQSPTYQLDSSSTNSLASSETSDLRQQLHYPSTSYDELPTPKSGPLLGPPLVHHLFMGPHLQAPPHVKSNMFYPHYIPDADSKKGADMDFGSPDRMGKYDTLLGNQALGSAFQSSNGLKSYNEMDRDEKPGSILMDAHQMGDFNHHLSTHHHLAPIPSFFMPAPSHNPASSAEEAEDPMHTTADHPTDSITHPSSCLDLFDAANPLSHQSSSAECPADSDFQNAGWSSSALAISNNNHHHHHHHHDQQQQQQQQQQQHGTHLPHPGSQSGVS
ncbi:hypothetical protein PCASD_12279 [Puccinia coronata f. sp. avenae]|uniref:Uncharacterized protein n=1 Tax=Puccinia coronata f. sp. avenae TaxID=200324 RepID=A0A2N5UQZ1_9BASI|nr:hypothetical protein PCASD_12279 [Puccinia coronata f. sp. avenae]